MDEFEAQKSTLCCRACGEAGLTTERNPNNNGLQVICGCGERRPLGALRYLRQRTTRAARKAYPAGESLDEVWARYSDVCVICGAPKQFLDTMQIGRHRHHVLAYAQHAHAGPIVPVCAPCHASTNERQRLFWWWFSRYGR